MSEAALVDLVPSFRRLLTLAEEESEAATIQAVLKETGEGLTGDLAESFETIADDIKYEDGAYRVRDEIFSDNITSILNTGNLESIFTMAGKEISVESREVMEVFRRLTSEIPERQLTELAVESRAQSAALASETETLAEIDSDVNNTVKNQKIIENNSKLKTIDKFFNTIKSGTKVILIAGVPIAIGYFLAEYIKNYIDTKSGAFLVTTNADGSLFEQKISKYSCMYPKNAQIEHPFDKEITAYLKNVDPCSQTGQYGPCAGWATIGQGSRLAAASIDVSKLGMNKTLICRTANSYDAIFSLTNHFLHKVGDIIGDVGKTVADAFWGLIKPFAPLIALVFGLISGGLTYYLASTSKPWLRIGMSLFVAIILGVIIYFIIHSIHFVKTNQKKSNIYYTPYLHCPSCKYITRHDQFKVYTLGYMTNTHYL